MHKEGEIFQSIGTVFGERVLVKIVSIKMSGYIIEAITPQIPWHNSNRWFESFSNFDRYYVQNLYTATYETTNTPD